MTRPIALLGLLAAMLTGCSRNAAPPSVPEPAAPTLAVEPKGDRLGKPVPLEVDGKPLASEGFYPFVGDFDGDGRQALLLGTRDNKGRLLIYRNVGSKTEPRLSQSQWFDDIVPTGRIPKG